MSKVKIEAKDIASGVPYIFQASKFKRKDKIRAPIPIRKKGRLKSKIL